MKRRNDLATGTRYLVVGVLTFMSGSALMSQSYGPKIAVVALLLLSTVVVHQTRAVRDGRLGTAALLLLLSCVVFVPLHTGDSDLSPYVTVSAHLIVGYLACYLISPEVFGGTYVNVMSASALVSVPLYIASQLLPAIASFFPVRATTESYAYHDALVHVFLVSRLPGEEGIVFDRNNGFAWEPGAYQVFLNLAILLLLQRRAVTGPSTGDAVRLVLLLTAVVTTFSTGGYIALAVILLAYSRDLLEALGARTTRARIGWVAFSGAMALFLMQYRDVDTTFIGEKFVREFGNGANLASERVGLDRLGYMVTDVMGFLFGAGFTSWAETGLSLWNSIIHTAIAIGMLFTVVLLGLYFAYCQHFRRPVAALILMTIAFSTETLFWRMLFVYLAFSAVMHRRASDHRVVVAGDKRTSPARSRLQGSRVQ